MSGAGDDGTEESGSARIRPFLAASPSVPVPEREPAPGAPRPFVLTSGRAADYPDIELESQVTARAYPPGRVDRLPREQRAILASCVEPVSVAEIAARLRLHLGVTKILVGDLRAAGYLDVHHVDVTTIETILRVIHGLRALA
jgi:Protein of unknown function (DUF742)